MILERMYSASSPARFTVSSSVRSVCLPIMAANVRKVPHAKQSPFASMDSMGLWQQSHVRCSAMSLLIELRQFEEMLRHFAGEGVTSHFCHCVYRDQL